MTTPRLVNWAGMLTDAGQQVADWLTRMGYPIPPASGLQASTRSLLTPLQVYLRALSPDEQAALWAEYQQEERVEE